VSLETEPADKGGTEGGGTLFRRNRARSGAATSKSERDAKLLVPLHGAFIVAVGDGEPVGMRRQLIRASLHSQAQRARHLKQS